MVTNYTEKLSPSFGKQNFRNSNIKNLNTNHFMSFPVISTYSEYMTRKLLPPAPTSWFNNCFKNVATPILITFPNSK